jgi:hypothetical protein
MRHRLTRKVAAAAMLGSALTLGGTLIATTTPASAAAGGTNVCTSVVGTLDLSAAVPTYRNTFSGCREHGSGTSVEVADLKNPSAPGHATLYWATGHATSENIVTSVTDPGRPCPAHDIASDVTIRVVQGAYSGSTGHAVICADLSGLPIIHFFSVGPVVI